EAGHLNAADAAAVTARHAATADSIKRQGGTVEVDMEALRARATSSDLTDRVAKRKASPWMRQESSEPLMAAEGVDALHQEVFRHNLPLYLVEATVLATTFSKLFQDSMDGGTWTPGQPDSLKLSKDILGPMLSEPIASDEFGISDMPEIIKSFAARCNIP